MNRQHYLDIAQSLVPKLAKKNFRPVGQIKPRPDVAAFQGWTAKLLGPAERVIGKTLEQGDSFVLDFGQHLAGYVRFSLAGVDAVVDAPVRVRMIFAESLSELAEPLDPWPGSLCRAWIQDEVLNLYPVGQEFKLPRRYAFRYVKVHVLAAPGKFQFTDIHCQAVTSASFKAPPAPKACSRDAELKGIFDVACRTLRDCMQTVLEDGPKRDRRLWLGDLWLGAKANYQTYRNFDLVKRCLYLLASGCDSDGLLSACVYEGPQSVAGGNVLADYAALFAPTLLDYAAASDDWTTAGNLWPMAVRQMELLRPLAANDQAMWDIGEEKIGRRIFADWNDALDKQATAQAVMIYSWKATAALAERLGKSTEIDGLAELVERMSQSARERLLDSELGLFVSGPARQVSYSSNAWMVLAGVVTGAQAGGVLTRLQAHREAIRPATPYAMHQFVEALYVSGMCEQAQAQIREYWGGMVRLGASTYWEIFDAADHAASPYKDHHLNSYCHAWGCGPAYFLARFSGSGQ